jgi:tetratricopeptide (TPR) repeat protein
MYASVLQDDPGSWQFRRLLAGVSVALGLLHRESGRIEQARELYLRACSLYEALPRNPARLVATLGDQARAYSHLARLEQSQKQFKAAMKSCFRAIELYTELVETYPGVSKFQRGQEMNLRLRDRLGQQLNGPPSPVKSEKQSTS